MSFGRDDMKPGWEAPLWDPRSDRQQLLAGMPGVLDTPLLTQERCVDGRGTARWLRDELLREAWIGRKQLQGDSCGNAGIYQVTKRRQHVSCRYGRYSSAMLGLSLPGAQSPFGKGGGIF
jgi:hypothetical protein